MEARYDFDTDRSTRMYDGDGPRALSWRQPLNSVFQGYWGHSTSSIWDLFLDRGSAQIIDVNQSNFNIDLGHSAKGTIGFGFRVLDGIAP